MHRKASLIAVVAMFSLATMSTFAQTGDKTKIKGMITSRAGETFTVMTAQGNVTVALTDSTKTKDNKGLLGARTEKVAREMLIPGLKVDIDGTSDNPGHFVATGITIDGDDLETSKMIQAGLTPTARQVAINTERIDALERRLVSVEGMAHTQTPVSANTPASTSAAAPVSTAAPAHTPDPAHTEAVNPAPAAAAAAEPAPAPPETPRTSANLLRVGLILLVMLSIVFITARRRAAA